jgi:hypothetical protein
VQYCVLKGYLRRVREYRISLDEPISNTNATGPSQENKFDIHDNEVLGKMILKKTLKDLYDGTNDSDSLACLGHSKSNRST